MRSSLYEDICEMADRADQILVYIECQTPFGGPMKKFLRKVGTSKP